MLELSCLERASSRVRSLRRDAAARALLVLAVACAETPIDAVERLDAGSVTQTGGNAGDAGGGRGGATGFSGGAFGIGGGRPGGFGGGPFVPECEPVAVAARGRYRLRARASSLCLWRGAETMVAEDVSATVTYEPALADCPRIPSNVWDLFPLGSSGAFWIQHALIGRNLDVEAARAVSGTRLVLWEPTPLDNQRFFFRPRGPGVFELAPAHVPTSCVTGDPEGVRIESCTRSSANQEWQLLPDCP